MLDYLEVPHAQLSADALRKIVEEFVLQEGTDYGSYEYSLEQKVSHVLKQIENDDAVIVFIPSEERCNIVPRKRLDKPRA